ncbi:E3 ubiquitin-protein ligase znrf2 isoform X2 [Xenopus laevis]|uniref:E3 ubiquitin-protein ligase ZNRF1 n=1 Tax=Xenopus laevis TaxID=8355 RepID=A0A8J1L1Q6_XENLA|nr:E3 ubiquitin-protein ligase znrf2 isoform X2 [Xenopus laevis]
MRAEPTACVSGMGGRQSSSPAADGRTRAYSGSDIPSTTARGPYRGPSGVASSSSSPLARYSYDSSGQETAGATGRGASGTDSVQPAALSSRSRSVGGIRSQAPLSIPGAARDSGSSTPEEGPRDRAHGGRESRLMIGSLPAHLSPHLFGEDILTKDAGECAICLEELQQGDTIARLPCLCIYHKGCIDEWFEVNRSCPEHPSD